MRTVYLHVGQPKTGTSYVQSVFANNADALRDKGILYPLPKDPSHAMDYGVNSGNMRTHDIIRGFDRLISRHPNEDFLFSSEFLFREEFYDRKLFPFLKERGMNIKVVMFIRNPMSQFISVYKQAIKRSAYTGTIDEFVHATNFDWRDFARTEEYVENCEEQGVNLTVVNFTDRRNYLISDILDWLGLPDGTLDSPPIVVNRGLSFSEIEVMRVLRRVFGEKAAFRISDKLVNSKRDIESPSIFPRQELYQELLQEFAPVTKRFDDRFGDQYCRYNFDPEAETRAYSYEHQPAQLTSDTLNFLEETLGRNAYIDGMSTSELTKAFFGRLRDRLAGKRWR